MDYLKVTFDGESKIQALSDFIEENQAAPDILQAVAGLPVGMQVRTPQGHVIETYVKPPKKSSRIAKFTVDWNFDRTRSASVKINRDTGIVEVRPHRRHESHFMDLAELARIVCERSIAAKLRLKKKEKKLRRMKRNAA